MFTEGVYRHTYTSTASDITPQYRLTPNALLMYFQDSFARLMTIHRLAAFDIVKQQRMWVITEVHIDIHPTDVFWSENFTVELWVSELTSLRIYCDFRIYRNDRGELMEQREQSPSLLGSAESRQQKTQSQLMEQREQSPSLLGSAESRQQKTKGQLIASGSSQWNILDLETKRLAPTDFLAERVTVVPTAGNHRKVRFPKSTSVDMTMEHRATRLDLDFNFHVSNRSYVSIALLTMPDDVLNSQTLTSVTVHWLHETYLDDTLTCRMSRTDDGAYLHTLTNADGLVVCELMSRWQPQLSKADVSEVLDREL